uniref:RING-type E3 ubiquitin transferase n=1 Tax=Salvator merianae TaxID=96440 RepID=A0A8D0DNM4_SALMN
MATGNLVKNFSEEATCSLCLEYFKDPVTVDCGHNFCQVCITQCLKKPKSSCPQLQLETQEEEKWGVCGKHQEPLKLFCKEDRICICVVCDRSKEHKDHNMLPLEEAFEEYKVRSPYGRWIARLWEPFSRFQVFFPQFRSCQEHLQILEEIWSTNHRIIELEGTSRVIESNPLLNAGFTKASQTDNCPASP